MFLRKLLASFSILFFCLCKNPKVESEVLDLPWNYSNPRIQTLLFSYPGRMTPEAKKREVKERILSLIGKAKERIDGYFYSFDDIDILIALKEAQDRGVNLQFFGDREETYPEAEEFGFQIKRWNGSGIHHTKAMLFDDSIGFFGTGNFSGHGLIRDNNAYWVWNFSKEEAILLRNHLEEKNTSGIFQSRSGFFLFAPEAGRLIQDTLLHAVQNAKRSIKYLIFTHFDPALTYSLFKAAQNGVLVEGIYNQPVNPEGVWLSQNLPKPSQIYWEENDDFEMRRGRFLGGLLHHKTMIVDEERVLVGSYNFTVSARDDNREFFTEFRDPVLVGEFLKEWERVKARSRIPATSEMEEAEDKDLSSYFVLDYNSTFGSQIGLWSLPLRGNSLDRNSSGLTREVRNSFGWRPDGRTLPTRRFSIHPHQTEDLGFLSSPSTPLGSVQMRMMPQGFQWILQERIDSVVLWDGRSKPKEFTAQIELQGSNFVHTFPGNFRRELEMPVWGVAKSTGRDLHFCSLPKNRVAPDFLNYILQKRRWERGEPMSCLII